MLIWLAFAVPEADPEAPRAPGQLALGPATTVRAQALLADAASLFADTGNLMYLPWCLEGLAGAAEARGDYERGAELDGARDAVRAPIGVLLPPAHAAGYAQTLSIIRAVLTPAAVDAVAGGMPGRSRVLSGCPPGLHAGGRGSRF